MSNYHIANIEFNKKSVHLSALSFALSGCLDTAVLCFKPSLSYLKQVEALKLPTQTFVLMDQVPQGALIDPWALTTSIHQYAQVHKLRLKYPFHPLHESLDSKAHAFCVYRPLFESLLIQSQDEALAYLKGQQGRYVLKTDLGQSGKGHFFVDAATAQLPSITFKNIRLERWVERVFDFSSQWLLDDKLNFMGLCELVNNRKGGYLSSRFPIQTTPFQELLDEHLAVVTPILQTFFDQGYRGHLGVDAFIYKDQGLKLCALIEINPRKTMGYLALHLARHFQKPCEITLGPYDPKISLLPSSIEGCQHQFKTSLNLTFV